MGSASVMWFRRDLRLGDNPALLAAAQAAQDRQVVPLFVLDPVLYGPAGGPRRVWLLRSLRALDASMSGRLLIRHGDPAEVVPEVVRAAGAGSVHMAADYGVYGRERDDAVQRRLGAAGVELVRTGSPYAVAPGRVTKADGSPYTVFTPYSRAWAQHGWRAPAEAATGITYVTPLPRENLPPEPDLGGMVLPDAGEEAALHRWRTFHLDRLGTYAEDRNRPDRDGTSSMSAHLKYGEVHPRTLLGDLADKTGEGPDSYRNELCWREFYADVLWRHPESARDHLRPEIGAMQQDEGPEAERRFEAWTQGRTGFPIVDAGMRQLHAEGWVHNRLRMIVASFLVKDLHLDWRRGAAYFMHWLRDGDIASNNHGWQWVAGTGTDPAPYFRVFNPVTQGQKFDPSGDVVRRYVAELRDVRGPAVHEPWTLPGGLPAGYPQRIVDHATERKEALRRYEAVKG